MLPMPIIAFALAIERAKQLSLERCFSINEASQHYLFGIKNDICGLAMIRERKFIYWTE